MADRKFCRQEGDAKMRVSHPMSITVKDKLLWTKEKGWKTLFKAAAIEEKRQNSV